MSRRIILLAIASGCFATVGSLFGKVAANYELRISDMGSSLFKVILLCLTIISNTVGCGLFVKALNASGSSLPPTIASATTSYLSSAVLGWLIFEETVSMTWWYGISLILVGLLTMYRSTSYHSSESIEIKPKSE